MPSNNKLLWDSALKRSFTTFLHSLDSLNSLDEMLSSTFDAIDAAVIVADQDRQIVLINSAAQSLFGYSEQNLLGLTTQILYQDPEDFNRQGQKNYHPEASKPELTKNLVVNYKRKNGSQFIGETIGGPVRGADDKVLFYVAIIKNISKRVSAEKALNRLHLITSNRQLNFEQRVHEILQLGCEHFNLPIGIFSHIQDDSYNVIQVVHPENTLQPGTEFSLAETYCSHTLRADGPVGFHHAGNSDIHDHPCYINFGLEAYLGSPIHVDGEVYGTLNFSSPETCPPFSAQDIELVRLFSHWLGHEIARNNDVKALKKAQDELQKLAITDTLTGLYNRRYMGQRLLEELDRLNRYPGNLTLALLDFDHFKRLNDEHGHHIGDQALREFASLAKNILRESDVFARWGGEEFLIAFTETALPQAHRVLERLQEALVAQPLQVDEKNEVTIKISVGLVMAMPNELKDSLIRRADEAMYQAKSQGRDQIYCA